MTTKEVRQRVKDAIIAQDGKLYNYNYNNLKKLYGIDVIQFQNAANYFRHSPQQEAFRKKYNYQ
jgi:hypothetical protein